MTNDIQKINYNNRNYIWDGNKQDLSMFRIEEENPVTVPKYLTKYYRLTKYSIESLLNNFIYAAHPKELNDPFDCYPSLIDTAEIIKEDIDFIENSLAIKVDRDYILNKNHQKDFIKILYDLIFRRCGIISITDSKNENPSLWANYSDNHKGFAVTYKTETFQKIALGPFKVDYVEKLQKLKYKSKEINALTLWLTCIKSIYWSMEEEWRFIGIGEDEMYVPYNHYNKERELKKNNRKLYLPKNSISEVRLGFYFFEYENISKNNLNESVVNLNNEKNKEFKINLLNHVKTNKIPLSLVHLNKDEYKFQPVLLDYDFIKETNTFKWRLPSN